MFRPAAIIAVCLALRGLAIPTTNNDDLSKEQSEHQIFNAAGSFGPEILDGQRKTIVEDEAFPTNHASFSRYHGVEEVPSTVDYASALNKASTYVQAKTPVERPAAPPSGSIAKSGPATSTHISTPERAKSSTASSSSAPTHTELPESAKSKPTDAPKISRETERLHLTTALSPIKLSEEQTRFRASAVETGEEQQESKNLRPTSTITFSPRPQQSSQPNPGVPTEKAEESPEPKRQVPKESNSQQSYKPHPELSTEATPESPELTKTITNEPQPEHSSKPHPELSTEATSKSPEVTKATTNEPQPERSSKPRPELSTEAASKSPKVTKTITNESQPEHLSKPHPDASTETDPPSEATKSIPKQSLSQQSRQPDPSSPTHVHPSSPEITSHQPHSTSSTQVHPSSIEVANSISEQSRPHSPPVSSFTSVTVPVADSTGGSLPRISLPMTRDTMDDIPNFDQSESKGKLSIALPTSKIAVDPGYSSSSLNQPSLPSPTKPTYTTGKPEPTTRSSEASETVICPTTTTATLNSSSSTQQQLSESTIPTSSPNVQPRCHEADASDTDTAFLKNSTWAEQSKNAKTPDGFVQTFENLNVIALGGPKPVISINDLKSYDAQACAALCLTRYNCRSFNIYIERDAVDVPSEDCPNPASTGVYRCAQFSKPIFSQDATNDGQFRNSFHVVEVGSNGYNVVGSPPDVSSADSSTTKVSVPANATISTPSLPTGATPVLDVSSFSDVTKSTGLPGSKSNKTDSKSVEKLITTTSPAENVPSETATKICTRPCIDGQDDEYTTIYTVTLKRGSECHKQLCEEGPRKSKREAADNTALPTRAMRNHLSATETPVVRPTGLSPLESNKGRGGLSMHEKAERFRLKHHNSIWRRIGKFSEDFNDWFARSASYAPRKRRWRRSFESQSTDSKTSVPEGQVDSQAQVDSHNQSKSQGEVGSRDGSIASPPPEKPMLKRDMKQEIIEREKERNRQLFNSKQRKNQRKKQRKKEKKERKRLEKERKKADKALEKAREKEIQELQVLERRHPRDLAVEQ